MEHTLIILSFHDASAECSCGKWWYSFTGIQTEQEILLEHAKHKSWDYIKDFPISDWQDEVRAGDTRLGYLEWIDHRRESEADG